MRSTYCTSAHASVHVGASGAVMYCTSAQACAHAGASGALHTGQYTALVRRPVRVRAPEADVIRGGMWQC